MTVSTAQRVIMCATVLTLLLCAAVHESYSSSYFLDGSSLTTENGDRRKRQQPVFHLPIDFGESGDNDVIFTEGHLTNLVSCLCKWNVQFCMVHVNNAKSTTSVDFFTGSWMCCNFYDSKISSEGLEYSIQFKCIKEILRPPVDDSSCMVLHTLNEPCPSEDVNVYLESERRLKIQTHGSTTDVRLCDEIKDVTDAGNHSQSGEEENRVGIIIGVVVTAVILIIILVVVLIIWRRKKRNDSASAKNSSNVTFTRTKDSGHLSGHSSGPSDAHNRHVYCDPNQDRSILNTRDGYTATDIALMGEMTNDSTGVSPGWGNNAQNDPLYCEAGEVTPTTKNVYARLHDDVKDIRNPYDMPPPPQKKPSIPGASPK